MDVRGHSEAGKQPHQHHEARMKVGKSEAASSELSNAALPQCIAPSPSSPRRRRLSVRHREVLIRWHLTASLVRGAFFLLYRGAVSIAGAEGGPLEGTGYAVSGGHSGRVSGPSRGSPQLRRPLGEPSGWRLAAD
ncbi:unnamed protein product [Pleuronectes platessa]|uniref:Uncharacterized protein n=1 Tax=Pleuronectes platessa TaxID=8262 RepID=A0A9N7YA19_PLEPL|nr:unnamed protein product [Pleuronectes platessa]